ncbi:gluconeogenesis factor YvcK family protein [Desulfotruncus alcoholivorax]|uniref:gluconeogenesis factor YvcK family protein n=1 Tax=Desulfotruncus alcoholivorax TaxID=265477 RepID=UPI0003FC26E2|nr:gluconeogenesis factor YvcK family protein [Desulfotruncus alcoholivorax]
MLIRWLYPGMKVKRWILLLLLGALLVCAGGVLFTGSVFSGSRILIDQLFNDAAGNYIWALGPVIMLAGLCLGGYGAFRAFRSLVGPVLPGGNSLLDIIYARRYLEKGPRIVVIGGGTGIPVLLRGLKEYTCNLTAIVTVADDGGSSGRLRGDLGILPPGDVRNCLVALAHREPLMEELLQYRFPSGELKGHNMGNLLLAALCDIAGGFDAAVRGLSRVLAIRGQVLPVTLADVRLCAELEDGTIVRGESKIPGGGGRIKRVFLEPDNCRPTGEALKAIQEADAIIMGPGSVYTSILPNLLVPGIPEAIAASRAIKIYICNVMTQPGETDGYSASRHLRALVDHAGNIVDYMIINTGVVPLRLLGRYRREGAVPVEADLQAVKEMGVIPVTGRLLQKGNVARHHPGKLARLVMRVVCEDRYPERVIPINSYLENKQIKKDSAAL